MTTLPYNWNWEVGIVFAVRWMGYREIVRDTLEDYFEA